MSNFTKNCEAIIHEAQIQTPSYTDFIENILHTEIELRKRRDLEKRMRLAKLPQEHNLNKFDFNYSSGIVKPQLKQLRELLWIDENYNIVVMGPSGTGKTFLASGLIYDAVQNGYRGYFYTMEDIVNVLRLKNMTLSAMSEYKRLLKAHIIAIDDIMLFPLKKDEAVAFFNLINHLHEKASVIITTNKSPTEWAKTLDDEVLASALLDRLLYICQVIKLSGLSYRMENRKNIFKDKN